MYSDGDKILDSIFDSMKDFKELKKLSREKSRIFAVDLVMVATKVRTAYLVDVVATQDHVAVFSGFLDVLRLKSRIFGDVVHVYDPSSEQSFIVNVALLQQRSQAIAASTEQSCLSFVTLDEPLLLVRDLISFPHLVTPSLKIVPCQKRGFPPQLHKVIMDLAAAMANESLQSTILPHLALDVLVPLAGFLLEYPVAYIPASTGQTSFLSGVSLDVYECVVDLRLPFCKEHNLLKFSCPSQLSAEYPHLSPHVMAQHICERFTPRLKEMGDIFWEATGIRVKHTVVSQDRVAL